MTKICIEIVGRDCSTCLETTLDCMRVYDVISRLPSNCRLGDPEHYVMLLDGKPVNIDSLICKDSIIKIVHLLRGG